MSTVIIDGLDSRTASDAIENYCRGYGRILNCYTKSNQCTVTYAEYQHAEEFIRSSPHRIDSHSYVFATWKTDLNRPSTNTQCPIGNSNDDCRLKVYGTLEQLEEKTLIRYFSNYGHVRMCLVNLPDNFAIITFDDRVSCERTLKQTRHFLNGRSLSIEMMSNQNEKTKRRKISDPNQTILSNLTYQFQTEREQLLNDQKNIQKQFESHIQFYECEKHRWNECFLKQQLEFNQQISHYQYLLKQSLDEIVNKDQQIEQLKHENKEIDDLLRQSVHDNEQQAVHLKKREDIHNQTKRKYEELYKAYMKIKDNSSTQRGQEIDVMANRSLTTCESSIIIQPQTTLDNVRKKL